MEVASQHWTDWTDWTVETIEINRKTLKAKCRIAHCIAEKRKMVGYRSNNNLHVGTHFEHYLSLLGKVSQKKGGKVW